jgi:hypothetical protein
MNKRQKKKIVKKLVYKYFKPKKPFNYTSFVILLPFLGFSFIQEISKKLLKKNIKLFIPPMPPTNIIINTNNKKRKII